MYLCEWKIYNTKIAYIEYGSVGDEFRLILCRVLAGNFCVAVLISDGNSERGADVRSNLLFDLFKAFD